MFPLYRSLTNVLFSLKCVEAEDEKSTSSKETLYQLSCYIAPDVKYLNTGLKSVSVSALPYLVLILPGKRYPWLICFYVTGLISGNYY